MNRSSMDALMKNLDGLAGENCLPDYKWNPVIEKISKSEGCFTTKDESAVVRAVISRLSERLTEQKRENEQLKKEETRRSEEHHRLVEDRDFLRTQVASMQSMQLNLVKQAIVPVKPADAKAKVRSGHEETLKACLKGARSVRLAIDQKFMKKYPARLGALVEGVCDKVRGFIADAKKEQANWGELLVKRNSTEEEIKAMTKSIGEELENHPENPTKKLIANTFPVLLGKLANREKSWKNKLGCSEDMIRDIEKVIDDFIRKANGAELRGMRETHIRNMTEMLDESVIRPLESKVQLNDEDDDEGDTTDSDQLAAQGLGQLPKNRRRPAASPSSSKRSRAASPILDGGAGYDTDKSAASLPRGGAGGQLGKRSSSLEVFISGDDAADFESTPKDRSPAPDGRNKRRNGDGGQDRD